MMDHDGGGEDGGGWPDPVERSSLAQLARRFGSPLYVYRLDRVRRAAADLLAAVPDGATIYYSLKANPEVAIVAELAAAGLSAEVSSTGELAAALAAGHPGELCLYGGPGKSAGEIAEALAAGVRLFSVESVVDYRRVARVAEERGARARCLVRVNASRAAAGAGLRMTGKPSQFGVEFSDLAQLAEARRDALEIVGTHVFSATNLGGEDELIAEFTVGVETTARARQVLGITGGVADLGGGFGAPYARPGVRPPLPKLRAALEDLLDDGLPGWRAGDPHIAFESGRALSADCGTLVCTVTDVKASRGSTYVVLDAGTNALGGMSGLGRLLPPGARLLPVEPAEAGPPGSMTLVGPLCTPLDTLSRVHTAAVPEVDATVAVPNVGAYGLHASLLAFLGRPLPGIVVVDGDQVVSAQRIDLVHSALAER
jgi:diaminopimelate decarboxylase